MQYWFLLFPLIGYLSGSVPFGLLLSKVFGYGDIRTIGSGNIGATNVLRTGNKKLAALTLLLDVLKGALPVWLAFISADMLIISTTALCAVLGHMYPVWLKFKGGKGVATALGTLLAVMPLLFLAMIGIWIVMAFTLRISSLAALTAFALAPLLSYIWIGDENLAVLTFIIAMLVFWKHKENIQRLLKGEEPRLGKKKEQAE